MTVISVTRRFSVEPLLVIENSEFAHWYGLGVFWSMYGDQQGNGPYDDQYLISNLASHIRSGWYDDFSYGWFPMLGFELGMVRGGQLVHQTDTLVTLTDPDFTKGYHVGRDHYFTEAPLEGRHLTDRLFIEAVREWARDYPTWYEPDETLRYCLGCRIGELSGALLPLGQAVAHC